jgi:hypothetical protein
LRRRVGSFHRRRRRRGAERREQTLRALQLSLFVDEASRAFNTGEPSLTFAYSASARTCSGTVAREGPNQVARASNRLPRGRRGAEGTAAGEGKGIGRVDMEGTSHSLCGGAIRAAIEVGFPTSDSCVIAETWGWKR